MQRYLHADAPYDFGPAPCEPTVRLERFADISNSAFVQFQIWDFPGHMDVNDPGFEAESVFKQCGALVFVIDAQARPIVPLR